MYFLLTTFVASRTTQRRSQHPWRDMSTGPRSQRGTEDMSISKSYLRSFSNDRQNTHLTHPLLLPCVLTQNQNQGHSSVFSSTCLSSLPKSRPRSSTRTGVTPTGPVVVFSHGWPLNSDNWENRMFFLGNHGYRCIAHDRRGHGRSSQPWYGNDMDTYADDLLVLFEHLNLTDVMIVGHSTGGGEVIRFCGRHGTSRVSKAVIVGAIPPVMVKKESNPLGVPMEVFDGFRTEMVKDRAQFFLDVPTGPFFGFNKPGAKISHGLIQSWWQQGIMCG